MAVAGATVAAAGMIDGGTVCTVPSVDNGSGTTAEVSSLWDGVQYESSREKMQSYAKDFCDGLSGKEKKTIHEYTEERIHFEEGHTKPIYENINLVHRGVKGEVFEAGNEERSRQLNETLVKAGAPEGMVVYRCIDASKVQGVFSLSDEELVGMVIFEDGFVSTCHADSVSNIPRHLKADKDTVLEIYVPKGSRCVNIEKLSKFQSQELEVLFDKDQVFKVDSVRREEKMRIIRVISLM